MKLSKKGIYSLRVLLHLARNYRKNPLSVSHLAAAEDLPLKYLEQRLSTLRKQGILVSERGKSGGYSLRKLPAIPLSIGKSIFDVLANLLKFQSIN